MPRDKFRHSGFHRIGDRYANFVDPGRFLGRNPFDDNWMAPHDLMIRNFKKQYEIQIALPGYEKNEVRVDIQNNRMTIRANAKRISNKYRKFVKGPVTYERKRSFELGPEIKKDEIEAKFENGLLTIRLPYNNKTDAAAGRKKKITIG